jgi:MoxR-like ATPase
MSTTTPLTSTLGIQGWSHLDPILLAALAIEAPVLLVGAHGTAKTLLVERIAGALNAEFRHYNASLLNYDDLVGIPLPDDTDGLRFVGTKGAVWDAEFVFFDEINRCRPDLQNKMFPIVHERRIAGMHLEQLRHRWAAMNPPSATDTFDGYLGTEPLDAALADRFWFTVRIPTWSSLTRAEREALVAGECTEASGADLADLIARTRTELELVRVEIGPITTRYAVTLVDLLAEAGIPLSPRRAAMLQRAVQATVAATRALGVVATLQETCELVVRNALPQWGDAEPPSTAKVLAANVQACAVALAASDSVRRSLLEERDPLSRVNLALRLNADDATLATVVIGALAAQPSDAHRVALSAVFTDVLAERTMTPAAWSSIADKAARVHRPGERTVQVAPGKRLESWRRAAGWLAGNPPSNALGELEHAVINACGAELLEHINVEVLVDDLRRYATTFKWGKR